jgi:hypothetical protein
MVDNPTDESIGGTIIMGILPSLPPLPTVAADGHNIMIMIGNQQQGDAKDDEEILTAFAGMTGQNNVLDVEDMEVLVFGDGTSVNDNSRESGTCVSLFGKRVATED